VAAERIGRRRTQNQGVSSLIDSAIPWILIRCSQSNTTATRFDKEMRMGQAMADMAFDVLPETGINISLLLVWLDEWEHPENYSNLALLQNMASEGI
jgi:hypothetical protein